jgi:hypothetical protein
MNRQSLGAFYPAPDGTANAHFVGPPDGSPQKISTDFRLSLAKIIRPALRKQDSGCVWLGMRIVSGEHLAATLHQHGEIDPAVQRLKRLSASWRRARGDRHRQNCRRVPAAGDGKLGMGDGA